MILGIVIIFLAAAAVPYLLKKDAHVRVGALVMALAGAAAVLAASGPVLFSYADAWSNDWWLMDHFSALLCSLIALVYVSAALVSFRYIEYEYREGALALPQVRLYFSLLPIFVLSMVLASVANSSALAWLALESTTLSSTFLVGLYGRRKSVEAAWKYIILCSTGIALGLVGVLLTNYAAHLYDPGQDVFSLTFLAENARNFSPEIIKWAFIFIFIGFGTKVGLVPMHAWLPDAHSKAPTPISALFSGILLNVALAAIIRFKHIADAALGGPDWTNKLFIVFGVLSIALPALALLIQNNYKRMLAYSSIEHMGLISLAMAFPPLGIMAAVTHMIGHTLAKSFLFFGAGEILLKWQTTKIDKIKGVMKFAPYTGTLFLLGILAIIAVPPSVLFVSEYALFAQMFVEHWLLALVVLAALSLIAFAMLRLTFTLLFDDEKKEAKTEGMRKENWNITHAIMAIQLVILIGLTFALTTRPGIDFIMNIVKTIN